MTPETGDKVRVTFEGEYSHRGTVGGFHLIDVRDPERRMASVPPKGTIEVIEKALPPEPPLGAMVTLNAGLPYDIYYHSEKGWVLVGTTLPRLTWRKLHDLQRPIRRVYVDPLLGAPELPYYADASDVHGPRRLPILVGESYRGGEVVQIGAAQLPAYEARTVAKAILAATGGLE